MRQVPKAVVGMKLHDFARRKNTEKIIKYANVKVPYSLQLLHCEGTNNGTGTATKKNNKRGYLANVRFNVLKH